MSSIALAQLKDALTFFGSTIDKANQADSQQFWNGFREPVLPRIGELFEHWVNTPQETRRGVIEFDATSGDTLNHRQAKL